MLTKQSRQSAKIFVHSTVNTYIRSVFASMVIVHTGKQVIEEASSSNMEQDGTTCMQSMYSRATCFIATY